MNNTKNNQIMVKDVLQGDPTLDMRSDYGNLSYEDLEDALDLILNHPTLNASEKLYYLENSWRIHYRKRPPLIQDFLTSTFLGPTAEDLYSYVYDSLLKF